MVAAKSPMQMVCTCLAAVPVPAYQQRPQAALQSWLLLCPFSTVCALQKYDALKSTNDRMHEQMHALQRKLVNVVTENEAMRHVIDKLQCHVLGLRRQLHHAGLKPTVQLDEELLRPCPHKVGQRQSVGGLATLQHASH